VGGRESDDNQESVAEVVLCVIGLRKLSLHGVKLLVYNGVRVGEVTDVDLNESRNVVVQVEVYSGHRAKVYRDALFTIDRPGGLIDISGERQIIIMDTDAGRTPIKQAAIITGNDNAFRPWLEKGKELFRSVLPGGTSTDASVSSP
jgi:sporulation protein YlmC with PRC-barrel domain